MNNIDVQPCEHRGRQRWDHIAREGWDAMFRPDYWSRTRYAGQFKVGDFIDVQAEDRSFSGLVEVRYANGMAVMVGECWRKVWSAAESVVEDEGFTVEHVPAHRWRVVRKSDKEIMFKGGETKADAEAWLARHLEAVAA